MENAEWAERVNEILERERNGKSEGNNIESDGVIGKGKLGMLTGSSVKLKMVALEMRRFH